MCECGLKRIPPPTTLPPDLPTLSSTSEAMSHNQPLLSSTIEADDTDSPFPSGNIGSPNATAAPARPPPLSTSNSGLPTPVTQGNAQAGQDEGVVAMFKRSSHPVSPLLAGKGTSGREVGRGWSQAYEMV